MQIIFILCKNGVKAPVKPILNNRHYLKTLQIKFLLSMLALDVKLYENSLLNTAK